MEVLEVDEENNTPSHLTSASAFVEGGIQEACEDACSICLEAFTETDPSTITSCKHEFHLQCILEWCQRSSNCPMCWQPISLQDPASQELLEAVEQERSFRFTPRRNSTIFHHRTLGDFELHHLPVDANDAQLEERIIQHLAAASAMGRAGYVAQRDGSRNRLSAQGRRQLLVFSAHPSTPSAGPVSSSPGEQVEPEAASVTVATPSGPLTAGGDVLPQHGRQFPSVQSSSTSASTSGSSVMSVNRHEIAMRRHFSSQSSMPNPDSAGASDFHYLPNSWKSRLNAMSRKYKDSILKSTRVWKEKLFSRNTSMADIGSGVKREVNSGIHNVSHMMERLEASENDTTANVSSFNNLADSSAVEQSNGNNIETPHRETVTTDSNAAAFSASSV